MRGPRLVLVAAALVAAGCDAHVATGEWETSGVRPSVDPIAAQPSVALGAAPAGTGATLDALPWDERIAIEQALAANDPRYAPRMDETGPVLETPGSVIATFDARGAALSFGGRETTLWVAAIGREGAMCPLPRTSRPEVAASEVRTNLGDGIVEWWRALPSGLEHGITIAERPAAPGELVIEVAMTGAVSATVVSDDAVELRNARGARVATYAHLVVLDADGTRVPARMSLGGERIALVIDDADARYPLVVDPLVTAEEAALVGARGYSVALSADGSVALGGASYFGGGVVFLRTGASWAQEAALAPGGHSVSLSSAGDRALLGRLGTGALLGARVFLRTGTTWSEEANLLSPDGPEELGAAVSLSGDGSRALVGAYYDTTGAGVAAGSARVFLRTGSTWAEEAALVAPDDAANDRLGYSVSLSSDGTRALVGALYDDLGASDAGSARVFSRTGTAWAYEAMLSAADGGASDELGYSVALSADGSRAVVGAWNDDTPAVDAGSVRIFARTVSSWADEATLVLSDGAPGDVFGCSVAVSADASRAAVGAFGDDGGAGSVRLFLRTGTSWAEQAALLPPTGAAGAFGWSVALSADGSRAVVGTETGTAYVFTVFGSDGSTCEADGACLSGFCTDGVCCGTRCAGGANDCQACSAALTGGASGACGLLSATVAPTVTCRTATDLCDPAEICTSVSAVCPADDLALAGTVCRPPATPCDVAEVCSGASATCPADGVASTTTVCRPAATPCDAPETCTGIDATCPADLPAAAATVCRVAAGTCDGAEVCDGVSLACPGDSFLSGVECRASSGVCDIVEVCSGTSATCPPDGLLSTGVSCRASADPACDPVESCDGVTSSCPTDVTMCTPMADGGPVDGGRADGDAAIDAPASGADAGTPPVAAAGCGCRAAARDVPLGWLLGLLLGLAILRRRRTPARDTPERWGDVPWPRGV